MHTYPPQEASTHKMEPNFCSGNKYTSVQSDMQFTLNHDVTLFGGIPPGRPMERELVKELSQQVAPFIDLAKKGVLGESSTTQMDFDRLKRRWMFVRC